MLKNHILTTIRKFRQEKVHAIINICGLAVGLACCLLIGLFVQDELLHDRQHPDTDRLFRISNAVISSDDRMQVAITPAIYAPRFTAENPQVEVFLRLHPPVETMLFNKEEDSYFEEHVFYADSTFFEVLGFPLSVGNPETALLEPFSVVLSPVLAKKYFGDEEPLGQSIQINERYEFTVTGVLQSEVERSHLTIDALLSMSTLDGLEGEWFYGSTGGFFNSWHLAAGYSYIRLTPGAIPPVVEKQLSDFLKDNIPEGGPKYEPFLEPITDIHLRSDVLYDTDQGGNIMHIYVLALVALFVLGIAAINYMNLTTARSAQRAQEVGVRKVMGAHRSQLIRQFLIESVVVAFLSAFVALILAVLSLPLFNQISTKDFEFGHLINFPVLGLLLGIAALVGLVSGFYPAFIISRHEPVTILKGSSTHTGQKGGLRRALVVFQFAAAVVFIVGTVTIYQQLEYFQEKDPGFEREHLVVMRLPDQELRKNTERIKQRFRTHPGVLNVAASSATPGMGVGKHDAKPEGRPDDERWLMSFYAVDYDFIETLGFEIAEGRAFSREHTTDSTAAYLINEAAARRLGWEEDAVGREFAWINPGKGLQPGQIVGVVEDFHYESLSQAVEPAFFAIAPDWVELISIRIRPGNTTEVLDYLKQTWEELAPAYPFEYAFLDEEYEMLYESEQRFGMLFSVFTALALFVACLGLFALASYTAERRNKEIGVRKVLGASEWQIVRLLIKEFAILVGTAFLLGVPVAYFIMNRWLESFAYHIQVNPLIFVITGILVHLIAFFTVSYQSIRAARMDPVQSLRYE